ncbi:MAG: DeoR/GlpR family DNA-binding transcription regulator [Armatimonadota bacterium]
MEKTGTSKHNVIAAERRRTIYRLLQENESVNAADLADALDVGISTIRRDLDALHDEGRLIRVHGGAVVKETAVPRIPYRQSRGQHSAEKMLIAEAALAFLPESGTVFMGGGTTTYGMATKLTPGRDISIVTNALDIAAYIASNDIATVDFVGGTIRPESLQSNCEEALEKLYWDITFMGLAAIDVNRGITTDSRTAAHQEITILKHGGKFIALCDSSKIGRFAYAQVAHVNVIDVLITDANADPAFVSQLREEGVEVVIAGS